MGLFKLILFVLRCAIQNRTYCKVKTTEEYSVFSTTKNFKLLLHENTIKYSSFIRFVIFMVIFLVRYCLPSHFDEYDEQWVVCWRKGINTDEKETSNNGLYFRAGKTAAYIITVDAVTRLLFEMICPCGKLYSFLYGRFQTLANVESNTNVPLYIHTLFRCFTQTHQRFFYIFKKRTMNTKC